MEETHCISDAVTSHNSSSAERNCHSITPKYTHNDGLKGIIVDCANILLKLSIHLFFCFNFLFYAFIHVQCWLSVIEVLRTVVRARAIFAKISHFNQSINKST